MTRVRGNAPGGTPARRGSGRRNGFVAEVVRLPTFGELTPPILTNSATILLVRYQVFCNPAPAHRGSLQLDLAFRDTYHAQGHVCHDPGTGRLAVPYALRSKAPPMADPHPTDELPHSLHTCWPKKNAVRIFRDEFGKHLESSFQALGDLLREYNLSHRLNSLDKPMPVVAVSLALGYLSERATEDSPSADDKTASFARLVHAAAAHDGLRDVMLTAGCAMGDDACSQALLEIIRRHVRPALVDKWGVGKTNPVIDDMPSHLLEPLKRGLNGGRTRLLTFYGKSPIEPWLRTIATRLVIDRGRHVKEVTTSSENLDKHPAGSAGGSGGDMPDDSAENKQMQTLFVEIAAPLFQRLLEQLRRKSPQQYSYAILRLQRGYKPAQIAVRLHVERSRVTQLSQAVCKKLLQMIQAEDSLFAELPAKVERKARQNIETAIHELLKADEGFDEPFDTEDEPAGDAATSRPAASPQRRRSK